MKFNCPKKEKQSQKGKNPSESSIAGVAKASPLMIQIKFCSSLIVVMQ